MSLTYFSLCEHRATGQCATEETLCFRRVTFRLQHKLLCTERTHRAGAAHGHTVFNGFNVDVLFKGCVCVCVCLGGGTVQEIALCTFSLLISSRKNSF